MGKESMKDNIIKFSNQLYTPIAGKQLLTPEDMVNRIAAAIGDSNFKCKDLTKAFFTILEMCAKDLSNYNGKDIKIVRLELAETVKQAGDKFLYG